MKFCPRCGSNLVEGANFCQACGYNLSIIQEDTVETPVAEEPAVRPGAEEEKEVPPYQPEEPATFRKVKKPFFNRVIQVLFHSKSEWPVIENEEPDRKKLLSGYILPLALIPAVAILISYTFFREDYSAFYGLKRGLIHAIISVGMIYYAAYLVDYFVPSFFGEKNYQRSFQMVAYAYTPCWVFYILAFIPGMGFLSILLGFIFMAFTLKSGIPVMKKVPQDKALGFSILLVICLYFSYLIAFKVLEWIIL